MTPFPDRLVPSVSLCIVYQKLGRGHDVLRATFAAPDADYICRAGNDGMRQRFGFGNADLYVAAPGSDLGLG